MKNRKFIISVILAVLINMIGVAIWWFSFSAIQNKKESILQLLQKIEADDKRLSSARSLNNLLRETEEDKNKVAEVFLGANDIVKFIEKLEYLGQLAGVKVSIEAINLPGAVQDKNLSIQAKISGRFSGLFQYLVLLENLPYKLSFSGFQFLKSSEDGQFGEWTAGFKIIILSYAP